MTVGWMLVKSFELAYRMQMEATDAFDINREPEHVRRCTEKVFQRGSC